MAENLLEPKKDKKGWYDDNKNLNYKDSWLHNTVELAALGTILTGAGALAVKGDLGGAMNTAQRGFRAMGKGFENYLKRNGSLGTKFGYQVGKRTFQNLRKMPKETGDEGADAVRAIIGDSIKKVDTDPEIKDRIEKEVARRLGEERNRNIVRNVLNDTQNFRTNEDRVKFLYEKVRNEEINKILHGDSRGPNPQGNPRSSHNSTKPFDKKQLAQDMVATGLTGLAFGAGISGFHAIDRASGNPDNQKKIESAFHHAGSFLNKEDEKMNKSAGALEIYNNAGGILRKTPEAVASGIGFTGISLGTAKLMQNQSAQNSENESPEDNNGTRVIIELGNENQLPVKDKHNAVPMGIAGLPRVATPLTSSMEKTARPSFNGLRQFVNDFRGYEKQIQDLRQQNPADIAAAQLRDQDIPAMVKEQYGNLANNDFNSNSFTKSLFESHTNKAKNEIDDQIRALETQTAKARLSAGAGGLALAGGGLAGLSAMKSQQRKEEESARGPA